MKKGEITRIANFIKDLEGELNEREYNSVTLQERLQELSRIIRSLVDETFKADQDLNSFLRRSSTERASAGNVSRKGWLQQTKEDSQE